MPLEIPGELIARLSGFGRVHLLDTVDSTNEYAFTLAMTAEPAIVVARCQTKGRGRFRRDWHSDDDSLTFSLLLFPEPGAGLTSRLTQFAGLSVCLALENLTGTKPLIRWPNDIMLSDRKLAGILCEQRKAAVAVGVGLNLNQQSFPAELPEAGSLRQLTGKTWPKFDVLEAVVAAFFDTLDKSRAGRDAELLDAIRNRSSVLHHRVEVKSLLRTRVGTVIDLDAEGRIVLRTESGRLSVLDVGQVRRLR